MAPSIQYHYRRIKMRISHLVSFALSLLLVSTSQAAAGEDTHAGQAVRESVQASGHASASAAHSIVASGQATSAAAAVPLSIGGAVLGSAGAVSADAARGLSKAANAPIGTPLDITEESITTMPPNEALKTGNDTKR
jgi:hypothetical protein